MNQSLSNLYKETGDLNGVTEQQVEAIVEEFWYSIRNQISKSEGNNILIHYLGSFEIPKGSLDKYIKQIEKSFNSGNMSKSKYEKGLENLKRLKELTEQNESRI